MLTPKVYLEEKQGGFECKRKNTWPTPPMLIKAQLRWLRLMQRSLSKKTETEAKPIRLPIGLGTKLRSCLGILLSPLSSSLNGSVLVFFPSLGDIVGERVVGVGCTKQGLNGEQDGTDL